MRLGGKKGPGEAKKVHVTHDEVLGREAGRVRREQKTNKRLRVEQVYDGKIQISLKLQRARRQV